MIITCPSCSARYKVKDGLITEKGKKVKCKKCGSVFVAYPHKDATPLAEAAPSAEPKMPPTTKADQPPPQATVRVDRSHLEALASQAAAKDAPGVKAPKPAGREAQPSEPPSSQATIQVDRSQIDAYVKQRLTGPAPVGPDPGEEASETNATIKIDTARLQAARFQKAAREETQAETPVGAPSAPPTEPSPKTDAPISGDAAHADNFFNQSGFDDSESGDRQSAFDFEAPPEPEFPSDEELGIDRDLSASSDREEAAFDFEPGGSEETATADDQAFFEDDGGEETLYKVRVDGAVYPELSLASLARWIEEGRLLENDEVAVEGTDDYRRADQYPAVVPYFIKFYGSAASADEENAGSASGQKKGLFSKLRSLFTKS